MFKHRMFTRFLMLGVLAMAFGGALLAAQEPQLQPVPGKQPAKLTPTQCYQQIWQDVQSHTWPNAPAQWDQVKDRKPETVEQLREMLQQAFAATSPSIKLLAASDVAKLTSTRAGGYPGIGISTEFGAVVTQGVKLVEVLEDSPAEDAGAKPGDLITHINGSPIAGWSLLQVSLTLKGEAGTSVVLTVVRDDTTDNIAIERGVDGKLGVELEAEAPRHQFIVTDVQKDTPAAKANIKVGDIFVAVDGEKQCDIAFYFDPKQSREEHAAMVARNARSLVSPAVFIRFSKDARLGGEVKLDMQSSGKAYSSTLTRETIAHGSQRTLRASSWHGGPNNQQWGWSQFRINNLDWTGLIADLDKDLQEVQQLPGMILDLRGADGSDPQIAAELVARFVPGQTIYGFTRHDDVTEAGNFTAAQAPLVYSGKLEVLVDAQTSGTAQAIAHALQASNRAKIRGQATTGSSTIAVQYSYEIEDGSQVSVLIPALNLAKDSSGNSLTAISPDYKEAAGKETDTESSFFDEVSKHAQSAVDPGQATDYGALAIALGIVVAFFATIALVVWLCHRAWVFAARRNVLLQRIEQSPKTGWVVGAVALVAMVTLIVCMQPPSSKAVRGEVVVKLFLDDSLLSKTQLKVAQQLEKEYTGPIRFVVIEADKAKDEPNHPDITRLPNVQICELGYAADGRCISNGSHSGGPLTKPEMVKSIQRAIENSSFKLPIVRQKAQTR